MLLWSLNLGAAAIVTGSLEATEAQDAASFAGSIRVNGTLAATEAQDGAAISGTTVFSAT